MNWEKIIPGTLVFMSAVYFPELHFLIAFRKFYYDPAFPEYRRHFTLPSSEKERGQEILNNVLSEDDVLAVRESTGECVGNQEATGYTA